MEFVSCGAQCPEPEQLAQLNSIAAQIDHDLTERAELEIEILQRIEHLHEEDEVTRGQQGVDSYHNLSRRRARVGRIARASVYWQQAQATAAEAIGGLVCYPAPVICPRLKAALAMTARNFLDVSLVDSDNPSDEAE